jgi:hypothetical protein
MQICLVYFLFFYHPLCDLPKGVIYIVGFGSQRIRRAE